MNKISKLISKLGKTFLLCKIGRFRIVLFKLCEKFGVRNILLPYPISLVIEPTNVCNLHCPACPTGAGKMNRAKSMMSFTKFKGIVDEVKEHIIDITLMNYGEPFLNSELLSMIKYATSADIYVMTSTNGEFFKTKEFCVEVVQSGLQYLIICLDGADQETLSKYRVGSSFIKIIDGIKFIREAKEELNSKTPVIELQFLVMKHNEHQKRYMKQLAKQLGVDVYSEKLVGIDYNDPEFQKMAKELLPNDLSLSRYFLKQDGTFELKGKTSNRCSRVYQSTVINSDGTVVPCCYDAYSKHIMGNVFEESLKTIWKNNKYQSFRRQIKSDRKSIAICNTCPEGKVHITSKKSDVSHLK